MNVLLDTGASCSLIDLGSLEILGLASNIRQSEHRVIDASGHEMKLRGSVFIKIGVKDAVVYQKMNVLDSKSYRNVLLGWDFLSQFCTVQFHFQSNRIQLGSLWYNCATINENSGVKLTNAVSLPARSESIVNGKCGKPFSLLTADFDPLTLSETPGVYATRCRIIPNIEGGFQVSFLNTSDEIVSLEAKKRVGSLLEVGETITRIDIPNQDDSINLVTDLVYEETLSQNDRDKISCFVKIW